MRPAYNKPNMHVFFRQFEGQLCGPLASVPSSALILHSDVLLAMKDNRYQDNMKLFENAYCVLTGGDILDALASRG